MHIIRTGITILMLFLATTASARWQPPDKKIMAADLTWPGRIPAADDRGYDVLDYDLELEFLQLPPAPGEVAGRATIRFALLDPAPPTLRLDLVDALEVSSVLLDGEPVTFTQGGDSLLVPLAGDASEVTIAYAGRPPRHGPLWAGLLMRQHGDAQPSVGNVSQPFSSHSWFPCKDHPADRATLGLRVVAPDTLTVVATGRLLATELLYGDRQAWTWRTEHPVATYVVGLTVSDFVTWEEDCAGVPLSYHVFAEHEEAARGTFAATCDMLVWLESLLGPYLYADEKYAQAEFVWGGAMENQTVTTFGTASLLLPERSARLVAVHELAHHWYGNGVSLGAWRDIWLNEGFARYVEVLWLEHTEGQDAALEYLNRLRRDDLFVGDGLLGDPDPILDLLVYNKGAWVLHMLRGWVGDAAFFAGLRAHANADSPMGREAFVRTWSAVTGRDVAAFLAPWLDTEAVPELGARWRTLGGDRRLVEVIQEQPGPTFHLTVPLRIHAADQILDTLVELESPIGGLEVRTAAPIDSLVIDPAGWLLHRTTGTPQPRLLAAQPRPNPARDQVDLAFRLVATDRVAARVMDIRGRLIRWMDLGLQPATTGDAVNTWTWDGRDQGGRRVAAGVYWLELRTPDDRTVRKVTLIR